MELKIINIPAQAANEEFFLKLKGTSVATVIAALRAFVDQPETHDLAKVVHNEIVDQANDMYKVHGMYQKTTSAGLVVEICTRDRGHDGPCNGYPIPGCPPVHKRLMDQPDF